MLNDLIINKFKEIIKLQEIDNFTEYSFSIVFLRDIHEGYLSLKDADNEQSKFANNLKNIDKGINSIEKKLFPSNIRLFFTAREKFLNSIKNRLFPIKNLELKPEQELEPELEPELEAELDPKPKPKYRKFSLKLCEEF